MFVLVLMLILLITVGFTVTFGVLWDNTKKENLQLKEILAEKIDAKEILREKETIIENAKLEAANIIDSANSQAENIIDSVNSQAKNIINYVNSQAENIKLKNDTLIEKNHLLEQKAENYKAQVRLLKEDISCYNLSFYEFHYDFGKAIDFEREKERNRQEQKEKLKVGAISFSEWPKPKESKLIQSLVLKVFNTECDLFAHNVTFRNIVQYENRIKKTFDTLNNMSFPYGFYITKDFLKLKLDFIRLLFEYQEKLQEEREEQRRIKEIMKDEIKADRELEREKNKVLAEKIRCADLLEKASRAVEHAYGKELEKLNAKIASLKQELEAATEKERKISEAQKTRAGYVYVISNIGSFGENVYKIGMTRRLEPQDRIDELSNASVPFAFDVHAMIWSENAPDLERRLHQDLEAYRINKMNIRKEFFSVELKTIELIAYRYGADVKFTQVPDAKEYRQTLAKWSRKINQTGDNL